MTTRCHSCTSEISGPTRKARITADSDPVDLCRRCYTDHQEALTPHCSLCGAKMTARPSKRGESDATALVCVKCLAEEGRDTPVPPVATMPEPGQDAHPGDDEPHTHELDPMTAEEVADAQYDYLSLSGGATIQSLPTQEPAPSPLDTLKPGICCKSCCHWAKQWTETPPRCKLWGDNMGVTWPDTNVCQLYTPRNDQ